MVLGLPFTQLFQVIHHLDKTSAFRRWGPVGLRVICICAALGLLTPRKDELLEEKRAEAESLSHEQPNNPKVSWDLARITLEQYFQRNLDQSRLLFYLALIVMVAGFGLVVWTIMYAIAHSQDVSKALIGVGGGAVTQLIGATFMVLYRSTIEQSRSYVEILERINPVGMAMQIIEGVPTGDPLHNKTRAEIAYLLLRGGHHLGEDTSLTRSGSKRKIRVRKDL
jgi:hypothetical protein